MNNKKKSVAFFFHDTDYYSGGTRSLIDIVDKFIENKKINAILVFPSNRGSAIDYYKNKNVLMIMSHYYQIRKNMSESKFESLKLFPKRIFDFVKSYIWILLFTLPKLKKNNVDIIYLNTSFIISGYWIGQKMKIPVIAHFREFGEEDHKITVWFGRKKYYKIVNKYSKIICISNSLKSKYLKYIDEKKLNVVYDDLSKNYRNWDKKLKDISDSFNILIAGNIIPGKGQLKVINSIVKLLKSDTNIKVYIAGGIGDDSYYKSICDVINKNNLCNQIILLGLVEDMNSLRKNMHMGIVASDMEAFGRVTIEGMLSGMIMLGTNSGGTTELLDNGNTGFLINSDLYEIEKIISKVKNNYNEYYNLLLNAYETAYKYTIGNCANEVLKIIESEIKK